MPWPNTNDFDLTVENIKSDIVCFANAKSVNIEKKSSNSIIVRWADRRDSKEAIFYIEDERVFVEFNSTTLNYRDFIASSYMADMAFAAQRILDVQQCIDIIPGEAIYKDERRSIYDTINRIVKDMTSLDNEKEIDTTKVLFIKGQAGSGKTIAMKFISRKIAEEYLKDKNDYLLFYIDAQGKSLSRIDEAISYAVSQLSFAFQANAIKALARNSLIIPIIDGFDELIGAGGFSEAFKSLSSLLASLNRNGTIIITGRSTFYDDNVLRVAANTQNGDNKINYKLEDITMCEWGEKEIALFIEKKYSYDKEMANFLKKNMKVIYRHSEGTNFRGKPFYIVKILEKMESLLGKTEIYKGVTFDASWYISETIDAYLQREALEKFKDRSGNMILSFEGHLSFLKELALELWWQEKRTIDIDTIESIAEIILEENRVPAEKWNVFIGKVPSYSFFKNSEFPDEKEFENQLFYDYFLALALKELLQNSSKFNLRQFLERSLLPESMIDFYKTVIKNCGINYQNIIEKLCDSVRNSFSGSLSKQNAGTIIACLTDVYNISNQKIKNIAFYGVTFSGKLEEIVFDSCSFQESKLYADFNKCTFDDCKIFKIYLDSRKIFHESKFTNGSICCHSSLSTQRALEKCGAIFETQLEDIKWTPAQKAILNLLKKFLEKTKKRFQFDLNPELEPTLREIVQDRNWETLVSILKRSEILCTRRVPRSGTDPNLYMLSESPDDILLALQYATTIQSSKISKFIELVKAIE